MNERSLLKVLIICATFCLTIARAVGRDIPENFPTFQVPGQDEKMKALRDLYHDTYARTGLGATLWDEWLVPAHVMPTGIDGGESSRSLRTRQILSNRDIDNEGYVATHQHASIAHQKGWPFPFWNQGRTGFGFHFSYYKTIGPNWRSEWIVKAEDWASTGVTSLGVSPYGWEMKLAPDAKISPPAFAPVDPWNSPYVQIRWKNEGPEELRKPYLEWKRDDMADYAYAERIYIPPPEKSDTLSYTMVPIYRHPGWRGKITDMRIAFNNDKETSVALQAFFAQYDTRHPINNTSYLTGANDYFAWTGDVDFLRENMNRLRLALNWMESEFDTETSGIVKLDWFGHDGRAGLKILEDGTTDSISGNGVGNNYWDLLPVGGLDGYATMRYIKALEIMADLERAVAENPQWNIPTSPYSREPQEHLRRAEISRAAASKLFWNEKNGRFILSEDLGGGREDYGFTFMNLEAICYGLASNEQSSAIMDWLDGRREVPDDTARGEDIYAWQFAPRATTKRNLLWYQWVWSGPHTIAFGDQVQDGGAVLGFSYHDVLARLKVNGPDDAWKRLDAILNWMVAVEKEGGPRAYYDGQKRPGTTQGNNVAGGLGIDAEFYETILIPMTILDGFLGWRPLPDGVRIAPKLPQAWPSIEVGPIRFRDEELRISATTNTLILRRANTAEAVWRLELPADGNWRMRDKTPATLQPIETSRSLEANFSPYFLDWNNAQEVTFTFVP